MALGKIGGASQADTAQLASADAGTDMGAQLILQILKVHFEEFADSNTCTLVTCLKQYFC
jgi:hypothetical protein